MKFKKITAALLSFCLFSGFAFSANSNMAVAGYAGNDQFTAGTYGDFSYARYSDHVEITNCSKNAVKVDIPEKIDGLPVTVIGHSAFVSCSNLLSVKLPDTLTTIEDWAFIECTNLSSINIPETVNSIGDRAFLSCSSLMNITLPSGIKEIKYCTFGSMGIRSIEIPDSVVNIGSAAFSHCHNLISVKIPENIKFIYEAAFYDCEALTSITIPRSVEFIGKGTFFRCANLSSVTILNPDCELDFLWYEDDLDTENYEFNGTIYGYSNSTAQKYAEEFGYKFEVISLGDVNLDGAADALDASLVLTEYAAIATGKDSVFNEAQKISADVNKDGAVDALDASNILGYYSFTATGGKGALEEYLNK